MDDRQWTTEDRCLRLHYLISYIGFIVPERINKHPAVDTNHQLSMSEWCQWSKSKFSEKACDPNFDSRHFMWHMCSHHILAKATLSDFHCQELTQCSPPDGKPNQENKWWILDTFLGPSYQNYWFICEFSECSSKDEYFHPNFLIFGFPKIYITVLWTHCSAIWENSSSISSQTEWTSILPQCNPIATIVRLKKVGDQK